MSNILYFTPGPSGLYPTVPLHIQNALNEDVCAISHRSKKYEAIHKNTVQNLKDLLNIPEDFHIFFTGSATEVWDRIIENCVEEQSFHCVNGSFSKRFYETAKELNRQASKVEVEFGKGFNASDLDVPLGTELICLTHNETSAGVSMPISEIHKVKDMYPDSILVVDAVSSMPYPNFDYSKVDSVLFSVQKGFGMPAGLGVWIVNNRCIEKSEKLQARGRSIGTYHNLPSLLSKGLNNQTPETPNVLGIYLLGKVAGDMLVTGIDKIRTETDIKAKLLYDFIEGSSNFETFVKEISHRSQTVIVANTVIPSPQINKILEPHNMAIGTGYAKFKEQQVRIANFPAFSIENIERLIDKLKF